jgi:hypothetical protein
MSRRPSGHGLLNKSKGARLRASSSLLAGEADCGFSEWHPERSPSGKLTTSLLDSTPYELPSGESDYVFSKRVTNMLV